MTLEGAASEDDLLARRPRPAATRRLAQACAQDGGSTLSLVSIICSMRMRANSQIALRACGHVATRW